jgi:hypothetical protein
MRFGFHLRVVLALLPGADGAFAQSPTSQTLAPQVGSFAHDRARLAELGLDVRPAFGMGPRFLAIAPRVRLVRNSDLPYSGNDGPLWAGRGLNTSVTTGFAMLGRLRGASIRLVVAPTFSYSENRPFAFEAGRDPERSDYSSPWHLGTSSADLPLRFGDRPLRELSPGESGITITAGTIAAGATTAETWWGPAIRNTLLLGNTGGGIPRVFVGTSRPIGIARGLVTAEWIAGVLTESRFFDRVDTNDHRVVSGVRATYSPRGEPGLTLGVARLVQAPIRGPSRAWSHVADAVTRWERLTAPGDTLSDGTTRQQSDQLLAFFARWVFPESGFETYGELARIENPRSLREWAAVPHHTQGYTLGLQWLGAELRAGGRLRLQAEVTYLEQTAAIADRPPPDYYTGRATPQGWTNRGQLLGAAIGPGGSSQFIGFDWIAGRWQAGAFVTRIRWENDALYRQPEPRLTRHDVTMASGLRGGARIGPYGVAAEITVGRRYNYQFQNESYVPSETAAIDIQNVTIAMTLSPR